MNDRPLTIVTPSALSPHEGDDVHGMHGRVRLAKDKVSPDGLVSPTNATARKKPGETWMDEERRNVQAYEYLCHIGEVKEWVEACIREEIDQVSELEESMRNGIAIAKLARFFAPTEVRRIFEGSKLQFRHIDNINFLFGAMKHVGLPEIFFFETTDLYDKKNIPKVIYCLHALAHLLFKKKMAPSIKNLIGKLEFTEDEINATQKGLDDAGISLPVFGDISSTLEKELNDAAITGGPTEAPEPELTEEQKRDRYWSDKDDQLRRCQNIARACARAHKERNAMLERKALHRAFANPESGTLVKFQAVARGVLVRKRTRAKLAEIKKATPHIIQLQAICRGHFARKHYRERIGHLKSHKDEIVKIQSKFRSHSAKKAFESLMRGENPPVGTIRNYVHLLLSNSDREFDEELELERLRQEAVTMIRENTAIESSLNELDNKIALLVKNRITVEEVVKTAKRGKITDSRDRLALSTDELDSGANNNMASMVGLLKSRDKESRKRLEAYQQLFYMLQTEPSYLAKLLFFMNKATAGEKQKKFVENIVLTIFGYAQNAREEYLLLKLFQLSITEEMSIVTEISEFLRGNPVFIKLAVQYNRGAKEMRYLRDLLQPRVKDVMGNRDLDLQTDPLIIYKSSIANEELQTGKKSQRPYEVTREQALADEDTRTVYIKHLQQLRTCADGFLEAIIGGVSTMPYGIRCIARQLRVAFVMKFGPTNEDQIMKVIGHFLYYRYMNPAIVAPEAFDVIETQVDPAQRKNLAEISKVLNQVSNGKGFADDNIYLQPLNDYVISASQKFGSYLKQVTEVPEPETQFQVDEFQDVTQKPVIYVSPQEIFMTHTVISRSIDEIAPKKDDPLRELLTELGPAPDINLEKESKSGLPAPLTLTKRYQEKEGEKMETRQLWVETKRYIMYILSVQSGKNLLDVLEKPVTTLENERFQQLLLKEQEESIRNDDDRKPTDSDPSLATAISTSKSLLTKSQNLGLEVWSFTFDQLKKTALENMAKLEGVGKVTKANYYQDMLNDIAKNIRDKHRRRQRRKQELVSIRQTLVNLNEKRVYLNEQKKSYNDYISGCMGQHKSKKDKAKRGRVMPFSHQYYHLRELKKSGKVPQFGSYKYTGERLLQKGVLISVADYSAKQLEKVTLTISSDEAGVFHIVATMLGVKLPGGEEEIRLEDLLQLQFDGAQVMDLFDDAAKVNVNLLIFLINKKFYV